MTDDGNDFARGPDVSVTQLTVSALPSTHEAYGDFAIQVRWYDDDRWVVVRSNGCLLSRSLSWDVPVGARDRSWELGHTFTRHKAVAVAQQLVYELTIHGRTVFDVLPELPRPRQEAR